MNSCLNCEHYKYYPSYDYYEPSDYDCLANEYNEDAWVNGVEWSNEENCPCKEYIKAY